MSDVPCGVGDGKGACVVCSMLLITLSFIISVGSAPEALLPGPRYAFLLTNGTVAFEFWERGSCTQLTSASVAGPALRLPTGQVLTVTPWGFHHINP